MSFPQYNRAGSAPWAGSSGRSSQPPLGEPAPPPVFSPNDVYIAVMGVTGAGKSTFISQCSDEAKGISGHGLKSTTRDIALYTVRHAGRTVRLIDTPGFDDTFRTDADVLRELAYYLSKSLSAGFRLTGIIYLHPITSTRMTGSALKNLRTFTKLCGMENMPSTVLATTMWDQVGNETGSRREQELSTDPTFWGRMVAAGSRVVRHTNTKQSAISIMASLMDQRTTVLQLQTEMVERRMFLHSTAAGKEVDSGLHMAQESMTRQLFEVENELKRYQGDAASGVDRHELISEAQAQSAELRERLNAMEKGRKKLQTDMERLIKDKEAKHQEEMKKMQEQFAEIMEQMKQNGQMPTPPGMGMPPPPNSPYGQPQPPPQYQQPPRSRFSLTQTLSRLSLSGSSMPQQPPYSPNPYMYQHPQQSAYNPPQTPSPYGVPQQQQPAQHVYHHYPSNNNNVDPYTAMLMGAYANPYMWYNPYLYGYSPSTAFAQQYLKQSQANTQAMTAYASAYSGMSSMSSLSTAAAMGSGCNIM